MKISENNKKVIRVLLDKRNDVNSRIQCVMQTIINEHAKDDKKRYDLNEQTLELCEIRPPKKKK